MNRIEQKNYKTKTGETINDRMLSYEKVANNHLIKNQIAICRTTCLNHDKSYYKNNSYDFNLVQSGLALCREIEAIQFGYQCMREVSFLFKDYVNVKQQQYFNGDIEKIVSVISSKMTNYYNNNDCIFETRIFNIPIQEVNNYFVWRQREHKRNSNSNGVILERLEKELETEYVSPDKEKFFKDHNITVPKSVFRKVWMYNDVNVPVFSQASYYVEKYL